MNEQRSFYPLYLKSTETAGVTTPGTLAPSVTVAATSAAVASTVFPGTLDNNYVQIQIANTSAQWAYVNFGVLAGGQTVTAATVATGYPVAPGAVVVVSVDKEVNAASVILASSTGNVIFTRGEGV
jgi:hypothetical protein